MKQKLKALPYAPPAPWMLKAASQAKPRIKDMELWYADASGTPEEMVIRIYERSKLIGGIAQQERYRILLDAKNRQYLTLDTDKKPPSCWREGRIDSILEEWFGNDRRWVDKGCSPLITFSPDGESLLEAVLWPLEGDETWGYRIYRWQDKILTDRRRERHNRELEPVDRLMEQAPELPEGFADWLKTDGIARFDYAVYDPPKGKKQTRIQCTRCGFDGMADVKRFHPVKDRRGICPSCGRPVTWKTASSKFDRTRSCYHYDEPWYVALIQRMGDGIIIRYFYADVEFTLDHGAVTKRTCTCGEIKRVIFPDAASVRHECYEHIRYKNQGGFRWAPGVGVYKTQEAFLYTDNLPEALKGTAWQYSGIRELQEKCWPKNIPVLDYLYVYPEAEYLEYFSKTGMTNLARDAIWHAYTFKTRLNTQKTRPEEILQVRKQDVRTLIKHNGGEEMLCVLQEMNLTGTELSEEDLLHYVTLFGRETRHLNPPAGITLHRALKYFKKQTQKAFDKDKWNHRYTKQEAMLMLERSLWRDWGDYLNWLHVFQPHCTDEYYLLPPDLVKAHDMLLEMIQSRRKKEEEARRKKQEKAVNRLLSEMRQTGGMAMQARGLLIRLPKDMDEIKREGELQHHCVATYIDRVERRQTLILFVRKISDPDTPFYTLEWKDGKVAQCRGMRNADMTPEVKTFVAAFERMMQKKARTA